MQIIRGTAEFQIGEETAAAIGKFDGIHRGHQALLSHILRKKEEGKKRRREREGEDGQGEREGERGP